MPFNLFGKRKKYPFNKRKKDPAAAVYAGPEYFERRNKVGRIYAGPEYFGQRSGDDRSEVNDVYAGPEYYEEHQVPEKDAPEEDAPLHPDDPAPVYAGPEDMGRRTDTVYAGPEYFGFDSDWDRGGGEVEIYAGPEYFEKRQRPEREAPEEAPLPPDDAAPIYAGPEDMGLDPEPVFTGPEDVEEIARMIDDALEKAEVSPLPVYAGPEYFEDQMRLVYAGPEYFAERRRQAEEHEPDDALFNGVYAGPAPGPGGGMGMMGLAQPSHGEDGKADGEA